MFASITGEAFLFGDECGSCVRGDDVGLCERGIIPNGLVIGIG